MPELKHSFSTLPLPTYLLPASQEARAKLMSLTWAFVQSQAVYSAARLGVADALAGGPLPVRRGPRQTNVVLGAVAAPDTATTVACRLGNTDQVLACSRCYLNCALTCPACPASLGPGGGAG